METSFIQITTTAKSEPQCLEMGRILVHEGLVACAQVSGPLTSLYLWQGNLSEETEYQLSLKTRAGLYKDVEQRIIELHNYQVPQIVSVPISAIEYNYQNWILSQTQTAKST